MSKSLASRWVILVFTGAIAATTSAQTPPGRDLTEFSLEDLMNIHVTSVSKKEQKLAKTGAAIFVITQEDIRRSGSTNIPDLLRMVPGVDVARVDHSNWAVSIRGFNSVYANKVLVLIDGSGACIIRRSRECCGLRRTFHSRTLSGSKSFAARAERCGAPMP